MSVNINITLKEIYDILCPKCKAKLRDLIKEKLPDDLVEQIILQQSETNK
jgi:hypothetical protein